MGQASNLLPAPEFLDLLEVLVKISKRTWKSLVISYLPEEGMEKIDRKNITFDWKKNQDANQVEFDQGSVTL